MTASPDEALIESFRSVGESASELAESFKSMNESLMAAFEAARKLSEQWYSIAADEYLKSHTRLPGSDRTSRLRKKRRSVIMAWYSRQGELETYRYMRSLRSRIIVAPMTGSRAMIDDFNATLMSLKAGYANRVEELQARVSGGDAVI